MGFNIGPVRLTELDRKKYDAFTENLGLAISEGKKISFADNDITNLLKLQHERIMDKGLSIDYEVTDKEEEDELDLGPMVLSDWKDAHYQNYVCLEEYDVKRTVKQDGKKQYSDRRETLIENALFLGTFEIPKSYIQKAAKLYYGDHRRFHFPEKLEFKLFLV